MLKELFLDGFSLESFDNICSANEREAFDKVFNNVHFSKEIESKILNLDKEINIVASVETWCPYARAFVATMKKAVSLNTKIKISFITMGKGLIELADILDINEDDFVVPTVAILDSNYNLDKTFIGFPKKYHENGFGAMKSAYFSGEKADEIIADIL